MPAGAAASIGALCAVTTASKTSAHFFMRLLASSQHGEVLVLYGSRGSRTGPDRIGADRHLGNGGVALRVIDLIDDTETWFLCHGERAHQCWGPERFDPSRFPSILVSILAADGASRPTTRVRLDGKITNKLGSRFD